MKKSTQKTVMAVFIIGTFLLSGISFIFTGAFGAIHGSNNQQTNQNQQAPREELPPLQSFVIDGELDFNTEYQYTSRGYTTLKVYANDFPQFLDDLPANTRTINGADQLIVQKIESDENKVVIISPFGEREVSLNDVEIFTALCETLAVTPLECALAGVSTGSSLPPLPSNEEVVPPGPAMGGHS